MKLPLVLPRSTLDKARNLYLGYFHYQFAFVEGDLRPGQDTIVSV